MKKLGFEYPQVYSFTSRREYKDFVRSLSSQEQDRVESWHYPDPLLYFYATKKVLEEKDFSAIVKVAANPTIGEDLLSILYKYALQFPDPQAAIQILHHPHLSASFVLEETHVWKKHIWTSVEGYGEILSAVALSHPRVTNPAETLYSSIKNLHWWATPETVKESHARRKNKSLFSQEELFLECLLLPQVNTHSQVLHSLFLLANTSLGSVSSNSSDDDVSFLVNTLGGYNPFEWVPSKVVNHPNCSQETLLLLFNVWENATQELKNIDNHNSSILGYHYNIAGLKELILNTLNRSDCSPLFLKQACWSGSDEIRRIASRHENCPEEDAVAAVLLPNEEDSLFL